MSFRRVFMSGRMVTLCVMLRGGTMRLCGGLVRLCRFGVTGVWHFHPFLFPVRPDILNLRAGTKFP